MERTEAGAARSFRDVPWPWLVAGCVLLLLLMAYVALAARSGSTAATGTSVAGVEIGGLTQDEATTAVQEALGAQAVKRLKVKAADQTLTVKPAEAGLALDAEASVAPAFGSTWNPFTLLGRLTAGGDDLPPVVTVDDALLAEQLVPLADTVDAPAVEPVVEVRRGKVKVTDGVPGRVIDVQATGAALAEALVLPRSPVAAVVVDVEPTVGATAIGQATTLAENAMGAPVMVQAGSVTARIPAKAVGRALSFTAQEGVLVPELDGAVLHKAIADELAPIEVAGRDASFKIRGGKVKVVKSKVGQGVSDDELARGVSEVLDAPAGERTVTVSVGTREPDLTTAEAKELGVTERLSTFTQYFPYAAYRKQNIGQAARRINGTILMPGETFSLNDTIKERTKKNGYTEGTVVGEGGVFAEALGGGVSTSATTAWTAAFYAGMERVQTVAHSIYISRYKPGLEATVAWGIFDMKFRNPGPNAVFITSSATGTSITVSMWGTKQYSKIEAEYGPRRDIVEYNTVYDTSDTCLGQGGVDGFTITVDRVFYSGGKEVRREPITTRYKPAPEVICGPEKDDKDDKPAKGDKPKKGNGSASGSSSGKPSDASSSAPADKPSSDKPSSDKPSDKPTKKPSKTAAPEPTDTDVFSND